MTALRGAGMRFNLGRAVCWVIMDARDGAAKYGALGASWWSPTPSGRLTMTQRVLR
jgi:hypothetical protein